MHHIVAKARSMSGFGTGSGLPSGLLQDSARRLFTVVFSHSPPRSFSKRLLPAGLTGRKRRRGPGGKSAISPWLVQNRILPHPRWRRTLRESPTAGESAEDRFDIALRDDLKRREGCQPARRLLPSPIESHGNNVIHCTRSPSERVRSLE